MRNRWRGRWLLAGLLAVTSTLVQAAGSAYDRIVDDVVARYQLPGIAVGVIEDGKVVYRGTRGELVAGSGKPVTSQSVFKIASNSKAMTASLLARLVEAGKLRWDDPVIKYLPGFRDARSVGDPQHAGARPAGAQQRAA